MNMLCESRLKIGMLGFCYFLGVVVGLVFAQLLAEMHGKKTMFCLSLLVSLAG